MKLKSVVSSLRLRTLPLSVAGVAMGLFLALSEYKIHWETALFIIITTISLQILSNLSNELGDALSGTDTADRQGPQYGIGSGGLSIKGIKKLIYLFVLISIISGLVMIYSSFGTFLSIESILLILLGGAAIIGAMRYTLGRNPYGYRGLGDIYVFIFFGIVSVLGSYFIAAHQIPTVFLIFPAISIGCFSVAVLNVNNIRDMKTDAVSRVTVALRLGLKGARIYQTILIVIGWVAMIVFCLLRFFDPYHYLFIITIPLFIKHLIGVWTKTDKDIDPMLPLLVISTFMFAILVGLGFIAFLL